MMQSAIQWVDKKLNRTTKHDKDESEENDDNSSPNNLESTTAATSALNSLDVGADDTEAPSGIMADPLLRLSKSCRTKISAKKLISTLLSAFFVAILWDAVMRNPEDRFLQPDFASKFLQWVQDHPAKGIVAFLLVIAAAVVFMIPIGTPLTVGCGYIYKGAYGWKLGLTLATSVSLGGSALGAVVCFLLGRYLMREQVRKWVRKYPLFDAIDIAAAEHGFRIMAMLYLTPILPLGPVAYMCGTTSMELHHFVLAKVASLPLMLLYAFIGASTGTLLSHGQSEDEFKKIEQNQSLILSGIGLSFVMIAGITRNIKKELNKILERQKKHKPGELDDPEESRDEEANTAVAARQRRKG